MTDFTLHTGDCLDIMPAIPAANVDMVLCDLPYGVTARNQWDEIIPFEKLWPQYVRVLKTNGAIVLTATQPFASHLVASSPSGWFKYEWIWEKEPSGNLNAKIMPMRAHENILVFGKKINYFPQGLRSTLRKRGLSDNSRTPNYGYQKREGYQQTQTGYPGSILSFAKDRERFHPTQKPVALMEYLIRTYTNAGDTVFDTCMGSGTTGVACMNTGRKFIGIEQDPKYFQIAKQRIEQAQLAAVRNETDWLADLDLPVVGQASASEATIQ